MRTQKMTPLMRQYWQIKSLHQDKILMFRMGDFFEMFYEDAEKAAPILNITLTMRNKKSNDVTKMCGVPHHSISGPIAKLLSAGLKVAICDQIEPANQSKGLVKRAVTRILTPGMVYDPDTLDQLNAYYLCAFDNHSISFVDNSTGEAFFYLSSKNQKQLINLLNPVELIITTEQKNTLFNQKEWSHLYTTVFEGEQTLPKQGGIRGACPTQKGEQTPHTQGGLRGACPPKKEGGLRGACPPNVPESAKRLLTYIQHQKGNLQIIQTFKQKFIDREMSFSPQTQEHLEFFKTQAGETKGSLFYAINRTKTPSGGRLLKARLRHPSTHLAEIENRLTAVEKWTTQEQKIHVVRNLLSQIGDVERKLGKISHPQCNGRDLSSLATSLKTGLPLLVEDPSFPKEIKQSLSHLAEQITQTIRPDAPAGVREGGLIQKGVSEELDQAIKEAEKRQAKLRNLENKERTQTQIPSLKIRYNNIFGYYIEVTKVHAKKVPDYYIRKQTLTQAERYTTAQLQEMEEKLLSSRAQRIEMEFRIFENLRQKILGALPDLFHFSRTICEMDVHVALAYLAIEQSYTRPKFSSEQSLVLVNSRHPTVEQKQNQHFVPNTIRMKKGECLLLTGPNMAGKSTLMRQTALSAIMAQAGSFVPAEQALLPVFNKLFTRIGASDSLSQGLSTFMMEMKESAEILNQADTHSLIILDEIGRGTATYDGMSLAQALLEYLVSKKQSLIFFATHYHELTEMTKAYPQIRNAHLSVSEREGKINFLYTLRPGALAQSYGIHVARLAGWPTEVITKAEQLLKQRDCAPRLPTTPITEGVTSYRNTTMDKGLRPLLTGETSTTKATPST